MDDGCRSRPPSRQHSGQLEDADEDAERDVDDERGRREEAERVAAAEAADELPAPATCGMELPREAGPALARPVGHREGGVEPDAIARAADPEVELPVLPAADRLVEEAHLIEHRASHHPEVGRLGFALRAAAVVGAPAEPDRGVVGARDRPLEGSAAVGAHHAADVGGPDA